jgi:hypothetical protein
VIPCKVLAGDGGQVFSEFDAEDAVAHDRLLAHFPQRAGTDEEDHGVLPEGDDGILEPALLSHERAEPLARKGRNNSGGGAESGPHRCTPAFRDEKGGAYETS